MRIGISKSKFMLRVLCASYVFIFKNSLLDTTASLQRSEIFKNRG
jgi:hypothetical protein